MSIKTTILAYAIGFILVAQIFMIKVIPAFEAEMNIWNQENQCIAVLVSLGVERSNIKRTGGTCEINK